MHELKPLPDWPGPKLEPFTEDFSALGMEFLGMLPAAKPDQPRIIKTRMNGRIYALQVFASLQPADMGKFLPPFDNDVDDYITLAMRHKQDFKNQMSAFYCECRAFGRLKEREKEDVAVQVYGYVEINLIGGHCRNLAGLLLGSSWASEKVKTIDPMIKYLQNLQDIPPLMGIIKEWIEPNTTTINGILNMSPYQTDRPQMRDDLRKLESQGIIARNLSPAQYIGDVLFDLSNAWTKPEHKEHVQGYPSVRDFETMANTDVSVCESHLERLWDRIEAEKKVTA